jgi:hypothetical protein
VGYLTRGAVLGHARFVGLQTGPTSSGRGWLLHVINVSVTPYTYDEDFSGTDTVLSSDSLKIAFRVHLVWRVRPDQVRQFVGNYSTLSGNDAPDSIVAVAYRNFLREPLRTYARNADHQPASDCCLPAVRGHQGATRHHQRAERHDDLYPRRPHGRSDRG